MLTLTSEVYEIPVPAHCRARGRNMIVIVPAPLARAASMSPTPALASDRGFRHTAHRRDEHQGQRQHAIRPLLPSPRRSRPQAAPTGEREKHVHRAHDLGSIRARNPPITPACDQRGDQHGVRRPSDEDMPAEQQPGQHVAPEFVVPSGSLTEWLQPAVRFPCKGRTAPIAERTPLREDDQQQRQDQRHGSCRSRRRPTASRRAPASGPAPALQSGSVRWSGLIYPRGGSRRPSEPHCLGFPHRGMTVK